MWLIQYTSYIYTHVGFFRCHVSIQQSFLTHIYIDLPNLSKKKTSAFLVRLLLNEFWHTFCKGRSRYVLWPFSKLTLQKKDDSELGCLWPPLNSGIHEGLVRNPQHGMSSWEGGHTHFKRFLNSIASKWWPNKKFTGFSPYMRSGGWTPIISIYKGMVINPIVGVSNIRISGFPMKIFRKIPFSFPPFDHVFPIWTDLPSRRNYRGECHIAFLP